MRGEEDMAVRREVNPLFVNGHDMRFLLQNRTTHLPLRVGFGADRQHGFMG